MARCCQGVALIVIALLVAFTDAGYYRRMRVAQRELLSPPPPTTSLLTIGKQIDGD